MQTKQDWNDTTTHLHLHILYHFANYALFVSCVQRRIVEGSGVGSGRCVADAGVHEELYCAGQQDNGRSYYNDSNMKKKSINDRVALTTYCSQRNHTSRFSGNPMLMLAAICYFDIIHSKYTARSSTEQVFR